MPRALVTVVLVIAFALSGCSSVAGELVTTVPADPGLASTTTATTATPATTAAVPPATTTSTLALPPEPATTSDDWHVVWTEIMSVRDWVASNPSERDVLLSVLSADCPCLDEDHLVIDGLAELGLVAAMEPIEILELREVARPREDRVVLGIEMYRPPFAFVESDGSIYQDDLGDWTETLAVSLSKVDGRWIVQSLEVTERILGS